MNAANVTSSIVSCEPGALMIVSVLSHETLWEIDEAFNCHTQSGQTEEVILESALYLGDNKSKTKLFDILDVTPGGQIAKGLESAAYVVFKLCQ